jgi:hypothetical protein
VQPTPLTVEQAAKRLGMKPSEIVSVDQVDEGAAVTTHDASVTLIAHDGGLVFGWQPADADDQGDDDAQAEAAPVAIKVPTVAEVLAAVGEDPDKAADALAEEQSRDKPRPTLVAGLQKILEARE